MTITRVFRVEIHPGQQRDFEAKFSTTSVHVAESAKGNHSVVILKPVKWAPLEYAMISEWKDEESLRTFVGENWDQPVIPDGMARYIRSCHVHHYETWD